MRRGPERGDILHILQEWQAPEGPSREQRRRAKLEKAMQAKIAADAARDRAAAQKSMHAAIHGGQDPEGALKGDYGDCLLYTSPSPRDRTRSRMPSSA